MAPFVPLPMVQLTNLTLVPLVDICTYADQKTLNDWSVANGVISGNGIISETVATNGTVTCAGL